MYADKIGEIDTLLQLGYQNLISYKNNVQDNYRNNLKIYMKFMSICNLSILEIWSGNWRAKLVLVLVSQESNSKTTYRLARPRPRLGEQRKINTDIKTD